MQSLLAKSSMPPMVLTRATFQAERSALKAAALLNMKFMALTAGLLVVEGAAIVGFFSMTGPKHVEAEVPVVVANPEETKAIELLLLDDRLVNDRTGLAYLYEVEVYVKVRKKDEAWVKEEIEKCIAQARDAMQLTERVAEDATQQIRVTREQSDHPRSEGNFTDERTVFLRERKPQ